ncbi:MAG: pectate lyase [Thermogutta sp.]
MRRREFCQQIGIAIGLYAFSRRSYAFQITGQELDLPRKAHDALVRAVRFFDERVSVEGGYVWAYSEDLRFREGEGPATPSTAWVQPPGSPSVGMALLNAYRLTKEPVCLQAASRTAHALVKGQLVSGGWDYRIEFSPDLRRNYRYRQPPSGGEKARNLSTLDDDTTQSALRFLIEFDRTTGMTDKEVHEAVHYGLDSLLAVQRPNGGWPQRFSEPPRPESYPDVPASYPEEWPRQWPGSPYYDCYTLNDSAHNDALKTALLAWRVYGDERYRVAARRAAEFLLKAQMPDPQPAWAQQYDAQMRPCWARKFEPPAISGGESQGVLRALILAFHELEEPRFLDPLPRALAYLERSLLPDGKLARFYELKTNRPLYFTRDYQLTYSDADLPRHYAFKIENNIGSIRRLYERARRTGPQPLLKEESPYPALSPDLVQSAERVVRQIDEQGRWVETGSLKTIGKDRAGNRIITTRTFIKNIGILSQYLAAVQKE